MQNTTTSNHCPNKLIEDFFVAGMTQDTLMSTFSQKKTTGVTPQILFSMYSHKEDIQKFVQFIFPHKVYLSGEPQPPMFHTFEITDEHGNQSFFHCFKFQEELNEYQVAEDFDHEGTLQQLKLKREKQKRYQAMKREKRINSKSTKYGG